MPFPGPFLKIVASGSLFAGEEIWSTSWSMAAGDGSTSTVPIQLADFAAPIGAWFTDTRSKIAASATLDLLKVNLVGPDGRYVSKTQTQAYEYSPVLVGGIGGYWPSQCTACVTLDGNNRRGPGSTGRFYPPMASSALDNSDGRIKIPDATAMAESARDLIRALNAIQGGGGVNATEQLSVVNASSVGAGTFSAVTAVRVGRVVDTQRRRRSALSEGYIRLELTPPTP